MDKDCNHVVAIQANPDGGDTEISLKEYMNSEVSKTFQNEMLDVCPLCGERIDWKAIHESMNI